MGSLPREPEVLGEMTRGGGALKYSVWEEDDGAEDRGWENLGNKRLSDAWCESLRSRPVSAPLVVAAEEVEVLGAISRG